MKKDEIQAELKSLSEKILLLSKQVAEIKEEKEDIGAKEIDFDNIERVGGKYPIKDHYIGKKDLYEKGLYINMLISVAMTEQDGLNDRLIFIERIRKGIDYRTKFSESYKSALLINDETIDEFVKCLSATDKISFVIDCFMMCGNINSCGDDIKQYIAEICLLLSIDKKMLKEIINVANVMLSQKLDVFKWDCDFDYSVFAKNFRYYLPVEELKTYSIKLDLEKQYDYCYFEISTKEPKVQCLRKGDALILETLSFEFKIDRGPANHKNLKIDKNYIFTGRYDKDGGHIKSMKLIHCLDCIDNGYDQKLVYNDRWIYISDKFILENV